MVGPCSGMDLRSSRGSISTGVQGNGVMSADDDMVMRQVLLDPMLTFIDCSLRTLSLADIIKACHSFYTLGEISKARDVLWKYGNETILPSFKRRRDSPNYTESQKTTEDVVKGMSMLDGAGKMPEFAVSPAALTRIPKASPQDASIPSLCAKGWVCLVGGSLLWMSWNGRSRAPPFNESTLDHFFVSDMIFPDISSYFSLHEGDNLSDHSLLVMRLKVGCQYHQFNTRSNRPSNAWHRASDNSIAEYKRVLALLLTEIPIPDAALRCPDPEYCSHREAIALYSVSINAACMAAAEACIPPAKKKKISGWAEHVAPFKEKSVIWHRI
ncbi:hypothetical protein CAPTEDRAFT_196324 [Capitella teleta]|uniref:Endonuclease/exonuclease/phosphatase domain-containing protein n=1 Tax=Capitella teleta TaxID=283909 RepID=R7T4F2_CAPTE|nr:hypothetical protein CAPTEDRAFT_196324 [Capitella teleta]|eukprot:ELT87892.1 hypothetical protein CAPTEDRAFT_196324 [Capitella teleta]